MSECTWWLRHRLLKPHLLIRDLWWGVLHRTTKRFNIVKLNRLSPDYYDVDLRMLHANFQLLQDFVEKEKPFDQINWESDEQHSHVAKEIKSLYCWWTGEYPARKLCVDSLKPDERPHGLELWSQDSSGAGMAFGSREAKLLQLSYPKYEAAVQLDQELEEQWMLEEEENLVRLMRIRRYLWT